jgi:Cdc6-like AAA superfamily ATPase
MELSGRPLFDNPLDAQLFVERDEGRILSSNAQDGVNTLIFGDRGSGKTSLLRHVLFELREKEFPVVGISAGPIDGPLELIQLVVGSIGKFRIDSPRLDPLSAAGLTETAAILNELRKLRPSSGAKEPRTALIVDLPAGAKTLHQLFGRFRDELWQLPYTWIVGAPTELRVDLLTPPADAFFENVVKLGPLNQEQQQELIAKRLDPGEETPWRLTAEGEENPRRLIEIVRESLRAGVAPEHQMRAQADRESEVAALGKGASMLYAELKELGPASASDEELLKRLGWSRQRAALVLGELEQAGFLRADQKAAESGRPRKVFSIVPPLSR